MGQLYRVISESIRYSEPLQTMIRPLTRRLLLWTLVPGLAGNLLTVTHAAIPTAALMKTQSGTSSVYVFSSSSPYVLRPPAAPADAQPMIQNAIEAVVSATNSTGGVIFLASGTYKVTKPIKIHGNGVSLVGLRAVSGTTFGAYPVLQYGDDFTDDDYSNRVAIQSALSGSKTVDVLQYPAVIRINGSGTSYDFGEGVGSEDNSGARGLTIQYTGAGVTGQGRLATGLALHMVGNAVVQDITVNSSGTVGPYNGINIGPSFRFFGRNFNIADVRGTFGLRCGDYRNTGAAKYHGVTVTSSGTTANLVEFRSEGELIGAKLTGGRIGVKVHGSGAGDDEQSANCTLRSVLVQDSALQGITVSCFHGVGFADITIKNPKCEGLKILDGFFGGLQIANLRIENAGLSGIRVQRGMNIGLTNAVVLNSGMLKSTAAAADLPIAAISIDRKVTSFNVAGARLGASGTGEYEDYGIYWADTGGTDSWHEPVVAASNVNFFTNVNTVAKRTNARTSPLPTLSIKEVGHYYDLYDVGMFNPLAGDSWTIVPSNCDFSDSTLKVAKGNNWYDLDQVRGKQWIDATKVTGLVTATGAISGTAFSTLLTDISSTYGSQGAVVYFPAGTFAYSGSSTGTTFTRKTYKIIANNPGLVIDKPNIQVLGDGAEVTSISISGTASSAAYPPLASVVTITGSGTGSGLFGFTVNHDRSLATPVTLARPYDDPPTYGVEVPAGTFSTAVNYAPTIKIDNTSNIRVGGVWSNLGMGGGFALVNTSNAELYQTNVRGYANNTTPTTPIAAYLLSGTTAGKAKDIRLMLAFAGGLDNIFVPSATFGGTTYANRLYSWNDADNFVRYENLPSFETMRIEGDVQRARVDCATFIHGKYGLRTVASGTLVPRDIELFRYATDHINGIGIQFENLTNADMLSCWTNATYKILQVNPAVTGDIRFANGMIRGTKVEGLSINGGNNIALVNCYSGRTCNITSLYPQENKPLAGIFIGSGASATVGNRTRLVGGGSGWIFYRLGDDGVSDALTNGNAQDWGIMIGSGFDTSRLEGFGLDLYGNGGPNSAHPTATPPAQAGPNRGLGLQTSGTSANFLTDGPNYP